MIITTENFELLFENKAFSLDDLTFELFMLWAQTATTSDREFQKVLASAPIARWFMMEFGKAENELNKLMANYPNTTEADCRKLFARIVFRIFSLMPKPLIDEARKRETAAETTKIGGINIEYSIISKN